MQLKSKLVISDGNSYEQHVIASNSDSKSNFLDFAYFSDTFIFSGVIRNVPRSLLAILFSSLKIFEKD